MRAGETSRVARRRVLAALIGAIAIGPASTPAAEGEVRPLNRDCALQPDGTRFCEGSIGTRVPSFDGVPLDVNVALPNREPQNLPLVILLHGWGLEKSDAAAMAPWARSGYAVLSFSARGFGDSCGREESRSVASGCERGWTRMADSRYEVRDVQWLAGMLADEGIVHPRRIGVTGGSYGGGQSLILATLRDQERLPDGRLVRWRSPMRRLEMSIAAAAPLAPWSDLAYALMPNGRTLDYWPTGPRDDFDPAGVLKGSYLSLYFAGEPVDGHYAPAGADPSADLRTWFASMQAGEPYGAAEFEAMMAQLTSYRSAHYIDTGAAPAPTLIVNGFNDDLFPADEGIRWANSHADAPIAQLYLDYGHPRALNKLADMVYVRNRVSEWFGRYVKGNPNRAPFIGAEAFTQTCPATVASRGPYRATTWDALSPGEVRFSISTAKTALSAPADQLGTKVDPIAGEGGCAVTSSATQSGTATYRGPAAHGSGYTLLGSPTVVADLAIAPAEGAEHTQLAARLWDVDRETRTQRLVARGTYRPRAGGRVVFQLHPNGWRFEPGHVPKLELLGRDAPYARPSNGSFTIQVSNVEVRLPVNEQPGGQVQTPAPPMPPLPSVP
jgi:hypothetical protein